VLRLVGKGNKPATMPLTVSVLRVLEACRGERTEGRLLLRPLTGNPIDRRDAHRMVARIAKVAGIPRHISPHSLRHAAITNALDARVPLRDAQILARRADPRTTEHTTAPEATSPQRPLPHRLRRRRLIGAQRIGNRARIESFAPTRRASAGEPPTLSDRGIGVFGFPHAGDGALELGDHLREVVGCRGDQCLDVDVPVAVNNAVAQSGCSAPGDLRVGVLRFGRDLAGGFPEDSEVPQER
jgi:Phage integrase family